LKRLLAKIDLKREQFKASDAESRSLMIMQPFKNARIRRSFAILGSLLLTTPMFGFSGKSCLDGHGNITSLIQRVGIKGLIWWVLVVPCGAMMISGLVSIPTWMNTVDD
jgi:hypothetical protein